MCKELIQVICERTDAKIPACKVGISPLPHYYIGNGNENNAFAHLTILLLSGRGIEEKQALSQHATEIIKAHFTPICKNLELQLTVRVDDMTKETYSKMQ